jgi:putative molybdenum carrier protein
MEEAGRIGKPVLHVDLSRRRVDEAAVEVGAWLAAVGPATLNVAGPRASGDPAIGDAVAALLRAVLRRAPGGE